MDVFVARQPIFDRQQHVYGYELLFRSCRENNFDGTEACLATSQVLGNALFSIGLDRIVGGRRAFVNAPRELLVDGGICVLPRDVLVIEVLESVEPDGEVLAACRDLKRLGYILALDDFTEQEHAAPLARFADIIKVDFRATGNSARREVAARYGRHGIRMLAEKVETREEFEDARRLGYSYFQGYFFARPAVLSAREIPALKLNYMRILSEIHRPELEYGRLEALLAREVSLSYKLLRYVNSSAFGFDHHIDSIRQALALMGEREVRNWASVAVLPSLASDKPDELLVTAVVRARFCERMARTSGLAPRAAQLFLMGLFSLLDAMLDRPLTEVLAGIELAPDVRAALLGAAPAGDRTASLYALIRACEAADWNRVTALAERLGVEPATVAAAYTDSAAWTDQVLQAAPGR